MLYANGEPEGRFVCPLHVRLLLLLLFEFAPLVEFFVLFARHIVVGLLFVQHASVHYVNRFGLAVRREAGKRKDLGSIPFRLSFLFKKVVVCGHCLVTLSITSY